MPQDQSNRPCPSNHQRGVLVGRPLQQYTPTTQSARHTSEPRMYWIGGQWAVESTAPPRLQPTLRRNEASSLAHHVESTPRSQAAAGSDRVIWVRPAQSPHSMENYTSRPLPHPYSRPASPPVHTYHRYQPYPPGTHSSTPIENSNRLPHPFEYDPQRPPALPDNVLSGRNEHRNPVNDGAGRKTLAEDHHHQDTTTISRSGNVKLSTRRHQAHLDSEKKRREWAIGFFRLFPC
jgi:hypothetical protein